MTTGTDRRSVLTGFGALAVAACGASPEAAAGPQSDTPHRLAGPPRHLDLSGLEATYGGRIGLDGVDTTNRRRVVWRSSERFVYCSTFKMYLAAATLLRVQAGHERLDRAIPIIRADMLNHAPTTEPAVGSTLTVQQLMQGTVELSDNPAANILIREMGGLHALRAFYRGIGDDSTRVDRLEPEMNRLDGDKDTITPAQSVDNIERLLVSAETPLSPSSKALLTRWMYGSRRAFPPVGPWRTRPAPAGMVRPTTSACLRPRPARRSRWRSTTTPTALHHRSRTKRSSPRRPASR